MIDYGKKISDLRKKSNLTQAELGKKLNVTSQAVSKWENNLSEPDLETIQKLCALLNVSINEFFDEDKQGDAQETLETSVDSLDSDKDTINNNDSEEAEKANEETAIEMAKRFSNEKPKEREPEVIVKNQFVYGYCDDCKKMITTKDYVVENTGRSGQHIYCKECAEKRRVNKFSYEIDELKRGRTKGLIWGAIAGVVFLLIGIFTFNNEFYDYFIDVLVGLMAFTFTAQLFYSESVQDCMGFFFKSFRMPGLIFSLDLDGIIWFITVKLLLGVLSWLLSALCFLAGVFITAFYSLIAFPFTMVSNVRNIRKLKEQI